MPYISRKSRKFIFSFMGALCLCYLLEFLPGGFMLHNVTSVLYCAIAIAWIITVERRVPFSFIKGYLVLGGVCVTMLFILRVMKWDIFAHIVTLNRLIWYFYYVPVTAITLFTLLLSLRVGKEAEKSKNLWDFTLIIGWLVLVVMIMTNDYHNFIFKVYTYNEMVQSYSYNFGYFIVLAWNVILTVLSFIILIKRSRNYSSKTLSWIPVGLCLIFSSLLFIYALNGGNSPVLFGKKMYNFQEVYGIMYIAIWESCLRIGLIPSNSDYDDIFKLAKIKAAIADNSQVLTYLSNEAVPLTQVQVEKAESPDGLRLDDNRRVKSKKLAVGSVIWVEDHTAVNELNASLKEAVERINEENSLLEIENEIKAEKQAIETRNRLYDSISFRTRSQLETIGMILERAELQGEGKEEAIKQCAILGAYVKRQANLSILAEQYRMLKLEELRYAIRESLENVRLLGIDANVSGIKANTEFDGGLLIQAYEIFEATIEAALPGVETISCILLGNDGIRLEILMDTPNGLPDFTRWDLDKYGAQIEILREDEGIYVRYYSKPSCEKNTPEDDEKDFKSDQDPENESGVKAP